MPEAVRIGSVPMHGDFAMPAGASGVIVFAHGSGSSRHSPRNRFVAEALQARGLATVLLDLLTEAEAGVRSVVFDIPFLAERLAEAIDWCECEPRLLGVDIGLFGASTGAAAALVAAAERPSAVRAVVSRGGRPDLAGAALSRVRAPTLLVVGADDDLVLQLNRDAMARLTCERRLEVVPGATHLFEEPGTLEAMTRLAADWFAHWLGRRGQPMPSSEDA